VGQIQSLAMLLAESFGLPAMGAALVGAVDDTLAAGFRTRDILAPGCRAVGTRELGQHIETALRVRLDALPAAVAEPVSPAAVAL
jgi:3-isopropylmalate dehydrogenase